jgi:hypothetical protein
MKIKVGAELFHADRQTDMTKLTVALRNFANAPRNALAGYNIDFCFSILDSQGKITVLIFCYHIKWQMIGLLSLNP